MDIQNSKNLKAQIPDKNLELVIKREINKNSNKLIYVEDLEGLTELDAYDSLISDITGLEYCI